MRELAILAYHKIGSPTAAGWETWYYVPESTFETQLETLRSQAWEFIGLDRLLVGLDEPGTLPEKAALITFDDGYRSNLEVAVPCLLRLGYPAVIFVPA